MTEKTAGDAGRKSSAPKTKKNSAAKATTTKVKAKKATAESRDEKSKSKAAESKKNATKTGVARDTKSSSTRKRKINATNDPLEHSEQMNSLLTRGFDLLEAGIDLGINLVNKLGNVAQEQVVEKVSGIVRSAATMNDMAGTRSQEVSLEDTKGESMGKRVPEADNSDAYKESEAEQAGMHIVNRLPISPNSKADISFSINNNSPSSPKTLSFTIEGFVGKTYNVTLDSKRFSIRPSKKVIEPMDFEKFMLKGDIPKDTPEDSYHGWIIVSDAKERFKIPVTLFISS